MQRGIHMVNGICLSLDTVSFTHVSRTQVLFHGILGVWIAGVYIEIGGDDAINFQRAYRKWLGIPSIVDEDEPLDPTKGWYAGR